ncbi:hypothetical protein LguiB_005432 [Lonicera macranthoides]
MSEDLLINILSRLKVKSLLCFKCVSKYWYTLIEGPDFIKNHYCNLNNRDMLLVLHYLNLRFILADPDPDYLSNRYICKIYGYDIVSDNELYNFVTNSNRFTPIANINSSDDECNPNTTSNKADSTSSNNSVRTYPKSSDELHAIYSDGINPEQAEVWSKEFALAMFHNDDIRRGQPRPPPYEDIIDITGIFSRIYYWHNISGPVDGLFLLHNCCADPSTNSYKVVWIPENSGSLHMKCLDLQMLQCIALLPILGDLLMLLRLISTRFSILIRLESIEVWVMKHEEEGGCWTRLFTLGLGPHLQLENPLGFWKNYNEIFFTTKTQKLVLYNSDTNEITHLGIQCDPDPYAYKYSLPIFNYKESLVSVGGRKKHSRRGKLHAMVQSFVAFQPTPP